MKRRFLPEIAQQRPRSRSIRLQVSNPSICEENILQFCHQGGNSVSLEIITGYKSSLVGIVMHICLNVYSPCIVELSKSMSVFMGAAKNCQSKRPRFSTRKHFQCRHNCLELAASQISQYSDREFKVRFVREKTILEQSVLEVFWNIFVQQNTFVFTVINILYLYFLRGSDCWVREDLKGKLLFIFFYCIITTIVFKSKQNFGLKIRSTYTGFGFVRDYFSSRTKGKGTSCIWSGYCKMLKYVLHLREALRSRSAAETTTRFPQ